MDTTTTAILDHPTMKNAKGAYNTEATHALVFMLAGVGSRWKQTVAYEFTGKSISAEELKEELFTVIRKSYEVGISVTIIVSDMGSSEIFSNL